MGLKNIISSILNQIFPTFCRDRVERIKLASHLVMSILYIIFIFMCMYFLKINLIIDDNIRVN